MIHPFRTPSVMIAAALAGGTCAVPAWALFEPGEWQQFGSGLGLRPVGVACLDDTSVFVLNRGNVGGGLPGRTEVLCFHRPNLKSAFDLETICKDLPASARQLAPGPDGKSLVVNLGDGSFLHLRLLRNANGWRSHPGGTVQLLKAKQRASIAAFGGEVFVPCRLGSTRATGVLGRLQPRPGGGGTAWRETSVGMGLEAAFGFSPHGHLFLCAPDQGRMVFIPNLLAGEEEQRREEERKAKAGEDEKREKQRDKKRRKAKRQKVKQKAGQQALAPAAAGLQAVGAEGEPDPEDQDPDTDDELAEDPDSDGEFTEAPAPVAGAVRVESKRSAPAPEAAPLAPLASPWVRAGSVNQLTLARKAAALAEDPRFHERLREAFRRMRRHSPAGALSIADLLGRTDLSEPWVEPALLPRGYAPPPSLPPLPAPAAPPYPNVWGLDLRQLDLSSSGFGFEDHHLPGISFAGALITPEQSALLAGRGVNLDGVWIAYNPAEAERWRRLFRPDDGGQGPAGGDGLVTR
jgi:hypothetical protein